MADMLASPFEKVGHIPSYEEIVRKIERRYVKLDSKLKELRNVKVRNKEMQRIGLVYSIIYDTLDNIVKTLPHVDKIHPFYRDLLDVLVGVKEYRRAILRLASARKIVEKIRKECMNLMKLAQEPKDYAHVRRSCIGRMMSVLRRNRKYIDFLASSMVKLRKIPSINPEVPTIIVAGMPQVGKSTLVKAISTAEPEIASYPFTTKNLVVGHIFLKPEGKIQVIDTPGLLDRPLSERNPIELQAIMALKHVKGIILYLFDISIGCYYTLEEQIRVFEEILSSFNKPVKAALNKIDAKDENRVAKVKEYLKERGFEKVYEISAKKGIGLKELLDDLLKDLT